MYVYIHTHMHRYIHRMYTYMCTRPINLFYIAAYTLSLKHISRDIITRRPGMWWQRTLNLAPTKQSGHMILKRCQYMLDFPCFILPLRTTQEEWPDNTKKVPIYIVFCYFIICVLNLYICIRTSHNFLKIIHVHLYVTKRVSI